MRSTAAVPTSAEPVLRPRRLLALRVGLLLICVTLALIVGPPGPALRSGVVLGVTVVLASLLDVRRVTRGGVPIAPALLAEAVLAVAVAATAPLPEAFLPYLVVPVASAGLAHGLGWALSTVGAAQAALVAAGLARYDGWALAEFLVMTSGCLVGCAALGLLAAWVRRAGQDCARPAPAQADPSYVAAYQLLSQLRLVSRQLSGGLDAVSLAQALLDRLHEMLPSERAAVVVGSAGDHLIPLAHRGDGAAEWDVSLAEDSLVAEAWFSGAPAQSARGLDGHGDTTAAVLPLQMGRRTFGLVLLEGGELVPAARLGAVMRTVDEAALRLETALLFAEVRSLATAEERRRLAREIHDGIAQELASLGYRVDDVAGRTSDPDASEQLHSVRAEISRIVGELRLSIFDLRSDVSPTAGLGNALSDYVQRAGTGCPLTMHLMLDESAQRLRVDVETELLRIAQEAITNARKHASAQNVWVTCRVRPPAALIVVEDDGVGLRRRRADSFGMSIMQERARRIGARLAVRDRPGGGTKVEVELGPVGSGTPVRVGVSKGEP